ncbi:MAG TPA: putative DNA-binding domain-containing protein [Thiobacillaceae bacterium]|nr:putative DNA-binding domain-containing protein [Thiobacillaceae bacterium]HNU65359.1 putative DNA-binding domain-containing protein [Thiobacillaceae bacterium]
MTDWRQYQGAFTARIRDPDRQDRPSGVPARRMRVYERLVYANLEGFLLAAFPVSRRILGARRWHRLVRAFLQQHACRTPLFRQIPEEFLQYLRAMQPWPGELPPFLPELAHYEWVELALDTSDQDNGLPRHDPQGDPCVGRPLVNPVLQLLAYRWPVHRLSPRFQPAAPPADATFLVVWRNQELAIRFSLLSPAAARLLELLQARPDFSGGLALDTLAQILAHPDPVALGRYGRTLLMDWHRDGILLGTRS